MSITRVNMRDHSFRDVAKKLVEDFESATISQKSTMPSWVNSHLMKNSKETMKHALTKKNLISQSHSQKTDSN